MSVKIKRFRIFAAAAQRINWAQILTKCRLLWVRTHWTDKNCLVLPKISTKFVSAKFLICQVWAHWDTQEYLLTTSVNHTEINTIACTLFAGKGHMRSQESTSIEYVASAYYCMYYSLFVNWIRSTPAEAVANFTSGGFTLFDFKWF